MFILIELQKLKMSDCRALMQEVKINSEGLLVHKVTLLRRIFKIWPALYASVNVLKTACHYGVSHINY